MRRARDTKHEAHAVIGTVPGVESIATEEEARRRGLPWLPVRPVVIVRAGEDRPVCGANFRSLADGSWRQCVLPAEHECAHAWDVKR